MKFKIKSPNDILNYLTWGSLLLIGIAFMTTASLCLIFDWYMLDRLKVFQKIIGIWGILFIIYGIELSVECVIALCKKGRK